MMKSRAWIAALGCAVIALALSSPALAQAKSPTDAYLAFAKAAPKATSLDTLLPFLSKVYRGNLSSQPAEKKPVWLQRLKDSVDMTDMKITKETITGDKCTLEGTAKGKSGLPLKGKVFLLKEDGEWKLDEQVWST